MTDTTDARIGGGIARLREQRGWSQRALARVVGLDQSAVSRIEAGKRRVSAEELETIARALGVSPAVLLASGGEYAPAGNEGRRVSLPETPGLRGRGPRARQLDVPALRAAIDDSDAIFRRLQAARLTEADDDRVPGGSRRESSGEPVYEALVDLPEADAAESDLAMLPSAAGGQPPSAFAAAPIEARATGLEGADVPGPARTPELVVPPGFVELPPLAESVIAGWFSLRASASSPRDWERPYHGAVSASGQPLHQARRGSAASGPAGASGGPWGSASALVSQPWSWDTPRDRVARFWRQELHVDPDGPVPDLVPLLEDVAGAEVIVARLESEQPACACTVRDGVPFLFVNAARPVVLQRYALAHAFGHLVLGHGGLVDGRIDWSRGNVREAETNDFAEEFLLPAAAVARWYERHADPAPDVETIVELANAFGVSFWAAMYRSRAARKLNPKRQAALAAALRRLEWQLLPRQAFLGGVRDTLSTLAPAEVPPRGGYGEPHVLRVPGRMRAWALRGVLAGSLSLEAAATHLHLPASELARKLGRAGIE